MRTLILLIVGISAFFAESASAQDFSGETIDGYAGSVTDVNGQAIAAGTTHGFANYNHSAIKSYPLSDFSSANFDNGTLNGYANGFQTYDFDYASFQNATLTALDTSAWQSDSFEYADLQGATLVGGTASSWQGIDFYHADLQGAIFLGNGVSSFQTIDFQGANLEGANFSGDGISSYQGLDLNGADLQGATFDSSTIFPDGKNYQSTSFDWQVSGMVFVATPEPSSWVLGFFALSVVGVLRYRAVVRS
jgi:uncharacterized protein YjbI with pentapeptide repeats